MDRRVSTLFGVLLFLVISLAGYIAIADLVSSQSQRQQQSVSPIFGLIERELVEPLHIAKTLDKIGVYTEYFNQQEPDQEALLEQLKGYHERLGLLFYLAHEKSRRQYDSEGVVFDLTEGKVIWYFELKEETDYPVQAVLGKREDVHLYIDIRQYDENGEFVGFVGVGKSLDDFITSFEKFKADYGHEFIFVNNRDEIVLSSRQELLPASVELADQPIDIKSISSLPWYDHFKSTTKNQDEPSLVVNSEQGDLLVSHLNIKSLDWSIYLLTPLSERQDEVNKSFAAYIGIGLLALFLMYKLVFSLVDHYAEKMSRKRNVDQLTKLSNRRYAYVFFTRQRKKYRPMATIIIDLGNLKDVNDKQGRMTGDQFLQKIASIVEQNVRQDDLVVRWGGQKFVVILPGIEQEDAQEIAQKCLSEVQNELAEDGSELASTIGTGVAYSRDLADTLALMVEWSEQAMYQAKREQN